MTKLPVLGLLQKRFPNLRKEELLAYVLSGEVTVEDETVRDPKLRVADTSSIAIRRLKRFVSRAGEKLDHAFASWDLPTADRVFADAGSSTGGFTDCLLSRGARLVYCIDVGYNQLAYELRKHPRVRVLERTNIMDVDLAALDPRPHAAVMDLSFRSIRRAAAWCLRGVSESWLIALVKPQFEWQDPTPAFEGVIIDRGVLWDILYELMGDLRDEGIFVVDVALSPVRGRKGNAEFLFLVSSSKEGNQDRVYRRLRCLVDEAVT